MFGFNPEANEQDPHNQTAAGTDDVQWDDPDSLEDGQCEVTDDGSHEPHGRADNWSERGWQGLSPDNEDQTSDRGSEEVEEGADPDVKKRDDLKMNADDVDDVGDANEEETEVDGQFPAQ